MSKRFFRWLSHKSSENYRKCTILDRNSYAAHPDIKQYHFGEAETGIFHEPQHIQDLPDEFLETTGSVHYPQPFVLAIKAGKLRGRHAVAYTNDEQIILESLLNHAPYIKNVAAGRVHFPQNISQVIQQVTISREYEIVFSLVNQFSSGFFHWFLECLPRLWLLRQFEAQYGRSIPVLIDPNPPLYVTETLEMMGVKHIIEWDTTFAQVEQLLIPMALQGTGRPSGFATKWVHDELLSALGDNLPHFDTPRIYISRQSAQRRRVINEAKVLDFLRPLGFESFQLEQMSITEQIALFIQAKVILGRKSVV